MLDIWYKIRSTFYQFRMDYRQAADQINIVLTKLSNKSLGIKTNLLTQALLLTHTRYISQFQILSIWLFQ